jgi:signal transduction histidine kinase
MLQKIAEKFRKTAKNGQNKNKLTNDVLDKNEKNMLIEAIEYRDNLIQAVNRMAGFLLNSEKGIYEDVLRQSMKEIADVASIDCVYLWKNHTREGKLYCTQIFEWSKRKTRFAENTPYYYDEVAPGWEKTLSSGKYINSLIRDLSLVEQERLGKEGILSILVIPLFIQDNFWGFVGFDDCHRERMFTKDEESILHSASLLIANSFIRNDMIQEIRDNSARLETALEQMTIASRAKSEFLSRMSHEMLTPMNAIMGMLQITKMRGIPENIKTNIDEIDTAARQLLQLIDDVLDISGMEYGTFQLSNLPFDFDKMIRDILRNMEYYTSEKQQTLDSNVDPTIPILLIGDEKRLKQVITSLLGNAVKFTPENGLLGFNVFKLDENSEAVSLQIDVIDNGIGIAEEQQNKLFDLFEQIDGSYTRKEGGIGIGLTLSKRIIEMMGGEIWVDSRINEGTKFTLICKLNKV